jgi:hypothetical protein
MAEHGSMLIDLRQAVIRAAKRRFRVLDSLLSRRLAFAGTVSTAGPSRKRGFAFQRRRLGFQRLHLLLELVAWRPQGEQAHKAAPRVRLLTLPGCPLEEIGAFDSIDHRHSPRYPLDRSGAHCALAALHRAKQTIKDGVAVCSRFEPSQSQSRKEKTIWAC